MADATSRQRRRGAPAIMLAVALLAVAPLAAGCSLVDMPSNRSLAGPPQSAAPSASPSASTSAAAAELDAVRAERQSADASSVSANFHERISCPLVAGVTNGPVSGRSVITLTGQVLVQRSPARVSLQLTVAQGGQVVQLDEVSDAKYLYLAPTAAPSAWVRVPLPHIDRKVLLYEVRNEDPSAQSWLFLADHHQHPAGHQSVDGVPATKYVGYFAPSAVLAGLPRWLRALYSSVASSIDGDVHFTLWVSRANQVKKIRVAERAFGCNGSLTETVNWFNQPVHITIPHAAGVNAVPAGVAGVLGPA